MKLALKEHTAPQAWQLAGYLAASENFKYVIVLVVGPSFPSRDRSARLIALREGFVIGPVADDSAFRELPAAGFAGVFVLVADAHF